MGSYQLGINMYYHQFKFLDGILCVFYSDEGRVRKVLKVEPLPDGSGHFFNLSNCLLPSFYYSENWTFIFKLWNMTYPK